MRLFFDIHKKWVNFLYLYTQKCIKKVLKLLYNHKKKWGLKNFKLITFLTLDVKIEKYIKNDNLEVKK